MPTHTPEPTWFGIGPLTEEEACKAGGTPPRIAVIEYDEDVAIYSYLAEFDSEKDRDRAVQCRNACASLADPEARMREWCEFIFQTVSGIREDMRSFTEIDAFDSARRWLAAHPEKSRLSDAAKEAAWQDAIDDVCEQFESEKETTREAE